MILCENVSKRFGDLFALKNISLCFKENTAIIGYNGAGKSTLLKIIAGIMKPSSGKVSVFGEDPSKSTSIRRKIGIVTHNPMLYKELSVEENLSFFAKLYGVENWRWVVDVFKLEEKLACRTSDLSRGYLQRVAIARAMMVQPRLLILDEPFSALDIEIKEILWTLIQEFSGSIILSTHNFEDAKFCKKFAVLERGELIYFGDSYYDAIRVLDPGAREKRY